MSYSVTPSSTSIDVEQDNLITLGQACRRLPKKPSPATLWRWRNGVKVNGQIYKLECVRVGGHYYTTEAAFAEFLRKQNESKQPPADSTGERTEATERRLAAAGLK